MSFLLKHEHQFIGISEYKKDSSFFLVVQMELFTRELEHVWGKCLE